jgi:hypothetical protein
MGATFPFRKAQTGDPLFPQTGLRIFDFGEIQTQPGAEIIAEPY